MKPVDQDHELPEGAAVVFDCGGAKGAGRIRGISARFPGATVYIVEATTALDPVYPYSCLTVPSGCLKTIGPEDEMTARDRASQAAGYELTDAEWEKWVQFCVNDPYGDKTAKEVQP